MLEGVLPRIQEFLKVRYPNECLHSSCMYVCFFCNRDHMIQDYIKKQQLTGLKSMQKVRAYRSSEGGEKAGNSTYHACMGSTDNFEVVRPST